jgi:hypothetical protein
MNIRDAELPRQRTARGHDRFGCAGLGMKELDGTNNTAERAIRPAVVARKISGGRRSKDGAETWATVASLVRTACQHSTLAVPPLPVQSFGTGKR